MSDDPRDDPIFGAGGLPGAAGAQAARDADDALAAFLDWLLNVEDAVLLAEDHAHRLREVVSAEELAALVRSYRAWQDDQAIAADEGGWT